MNKRTFALILGSAIVWLGILSYMAYLIAQVVYWQGDTPSLLGVLAVFLLALLMLSLIVLNERTREVAGWLQIVLMAVFGSINMSQSLVLGEWFLGKSFLLACACALGAILLFISD